MMEEVLDCEISSILVVGVRVALSKSVVLEGVDWVNDRLKGQESRPCFALPGLHGTRPRIYVVATLNTSCWPSDGPEDV